MVFQERLVDIFRLRSGLEGWRKFFPASASLTESRSYLKVMIIPKERILEYFGFCYKRMVFQERSVNIYRVRSRVEERRKLFPISASLTESRSYLKVMIIRKGRMLENFGFSYTRTVFLEYSVDNFEV
jgi:hypothetical protein